MSENDLNKGLGKPLIVAGLGDISAQIDRCFVPLGLRPESAYASRKYVGVVNGRSITITVALRSRNRYAGGVVRYRQFTGLWMDISAATPVMSRLTVGQPKGFARSFLQFIQQLRGNKPVSHLPAGYDDLAVFAREPAWGEMLLADTAVQNRITSLMHDPNLPPGAAIHLSPSGSDSPGKWLWTTPARPDDFTPESAQRWVYHLCHLAVQAEASPPLTAVQPTWLEQQNPRTAGFLLAAVLLFGIPFLMFVCCLVPALIFAFANAN